ncbi:putative heterokaryon incompatibility protein [Rosellinia necatrix]|uniref:Putative heterokaryon incompatibility protein n=1 Tax=Rosellinia necatrix TaxID=77044 RepID=A0A1S8A502_ROSNE|nr:putative heterokaryon incompatibility protein [Rosellinia necatrix]
MSSIYEPLNVEGYQIRILLLQLGTNGTIVKYRLEKVNLADGPRFVALSYRWGDPNVTTNKHCMKTPFPRSNISSQGCSYTMSAPTSRRNERDDHRSYSSCQLQDIFRNLEDLFNRGYWQRRWIIQEIAASAQVQFLCGKETISFRDIQEALKRYMSASHWRPTNDTACHYFQKIARLRELHHLAGASSLSEALLETQDFLSADARDKMFAIVGIGYDGAGLIPNPDYRQSPDKITRDLTRSLIRRNGCFDIIMADQFKRGRPDNLRAWSPNWLSGDLPNDAYFVGCTRPGSSDVWGHTNTTTEANARPPLLSQEFRHRSLDEDPNILRMEGIVLGTIDRMTSAMIAISGSQNAEGEHDGAHARSNTNSTRYYGRVDAFLSAFLMCILAQEGGWWHVHSAKHKKQGDNILGSRKMANRFKIHFFNDIIRQAPYCRTDDLKAVRKVYLRWLEQNKEFSINDVPLQDWLAESTTRHWKMRLIACGSAW